MGEVDPIATAGASATGTLATRVLGRDRERFVGRDAELVLLESCLEDDPPANVVLVHGPGGIGKSALLRELARRAKSYGLDTFLVEGRELPPMPDALEAVLSEARGCERPLVLIDNYERMTALAGYLRRGLLPSLPERTLVVIAGRTAPDSSWFAGGWERVATELELGPLTKTDALRDASERAFGDSENEKLLRRVLIHGYLEPVPSHEQAALDLALSRAAYFRRLRAAAERLAEYLAERRSGS